MKYFYICVAEFEAEDVIESLPDINLPNCKKETIKVRQALESVDLNNSFTISWNELISHPKKHIFINGVPA